MSFAIASFGDCALAQIKPDGTLGAESSVVTPTNVNGLPTNQIDGGAKRGANLFHSFEQFSVPTGGAAYFNNALDIQNIISRVTGESLSNIDGLLRANGTANLFLLNPNGIIFGPNAQLNIGGSFVASTASSMNFADGNQFSATAPTTTPLLRVSVPIGLQYGGTTPGGIQVQGSGLQVQIGQTLALVGGSVSVEGGESGFLSAQGGRIELGGLTGAGMVEIEGQQSYRGFRLTSVRFPDAVSRANVLLTNLAYVNVAASGGGSIAVNARNLDVSGGSFLLAGIGLGLGSVGSQAGDITLNATDAITVGQSSGIQNGIGPDATGTGGDISITTGSLSVTNGALLNSSTYGQGNAGSVTINARDNVSFDEESVAASIVQEQAVGAAGGIKITTGSLSVTNAAQLDSSTYGQGNAGSVTINARDTVSFDGDNVVYSTVEYGAVGNGGSINITAGSLSVTDGAQLQTLVRGASEDGTLPAGQGNAGNVNIDVEDAVTIAGFSEVNGNSGVGSLVGSGVIGNGGDITISSGSLSVTDGALLSASTEGQGNAGSVNINARDTVSFDGGNTFSSMEEGSVGNGGSINITTGSLSVTNGAQLAAGTFGQGNAGSVNINARDTVSFDGVGSNGTSSTAESAVYKGAVGNSGEVNIKTGSLSVTNGAYLSAGTFGQGNAGSVNMALHKCGMIQFNTGISQYFK
jgi:filamentous hemagglutinin family protein